MGMWYTYHIILWRYTMQRIQPKYDTEGKEYWQCSTCKEWKLRDAYYPDTRRWNGLKNQCKKCHLITAINTRDPENNKRLRRESARRTRQINPQKYRIKEKLAARIRPKNERTKAREILNDAVRTGKIIKPSNCSQCGKLRKVTAHHDDYSKPLQVRWLCYECHGNK